MIDIVGRYHGACIVNQTYADVRRAELRRIAGTDTRKAEDERLVQQWREGKLS